MSGIKNIEDLRKDLLRKYEVSKSEEEIRTLSAYTATASAIIRSVKTELDYNKYKENKKDIDFLTIKEE